MVIIVCINCIMSTMKTLTLSALVCAVMVLAGAGIKISCPIGWTLSNGRCFIRVPKALTWAEAEKNCQIIGGNLASVHNADEYHGIQDIILKATRALEPTWLGGSDCQKEGLWFWSDGTEFNYRHCGKFDNGWWKQHCLQMNYGERKCWDDVQCSTQLASICAKKPCRRCAKKPCRRCPRI